MTRLRSVLVVVLVLLAVTVHGDGPSGGEETRRFNFRHSGASHVAWRDKTPAELLGVVKVIGATRPSCRHPDSAGHGRWPRPCELRLQAQPDRDLTPKTSPRIKQEGVSIRERENGTRLRHTVSR